jgi:hypothetical protein
MLVAESTSGAYCGLKHWVILNLTMFIFLSKPSMFHQNTNVSECSANMLKASCSRDVETASDGRYFNCNKVDEEMRLLVKKTGGSG